MSFLFTWHLDGPGALTEKSAILLISPSSIWIQAPADCWHTVALCGPYAPAVIEHQHLLIKAQSPASLLVASGIRIRYRSGYAVKGIHHSSWAVSTIIYLWHLLNPDFGESALEWFGSLPVDISWPVPLVAASSQLIICHQQTLITKRLP
jgi:hypothetical protein